jgi:hypothetical protein
MVEKGILSWKGFYENERSQRADFISNRIEELLSSDDTDVLDVINRGGSLSFPHTVLDGSLDPVIRTAKALIDSDKDKVIAIAVLHQGNHGPSDEFSLDHFQYVMEEMKSKLGVNYPDVEIHFPTSRDLSYYDFEGRINSALEEAEILRGSLDGSTSLIMTGDLSHYGKFYSRTRSGVNVEIQIDQWVEECLDLLYRKNDLMEYIKKATSSGNDQTTPGIMVKTLLGDGLDFKIFQRKCSDYSTILNEPPPTMVASYFYGVWKV